MNLSKLMNLFRPSKPAGVVPAPPVRAVVPKNDNDALRHLVRLQRLYSATLEPLRPERAESLLRGIKHRTALLSIYGIEFNGPNDIQVIIDRIMRGNR